MTKTATNQAFAVALIAAQAFTWPAVARAAEATSELPGGGLLIAPHRSLMLDAVEVIIRPDEIRAVYVIRNTDEQAHAFHASFPLPEIDLNAIGSDRPVMPSSDPTNYVGAKVDADGTPVSPAVEQRAEALGLDVTSRLQTFNLPLYPFSSDVRTRLQALSADQRRELEERGIIQIEEDRADPIWHLRTVWHWRQNIAAAGTVRLQVTYAPVTGRDIATAEGASQLEQGYCLDPRVSSAMKPVTPGASDRRPILLSTFQLASGSILPSAATTFRLKIEKPAGYTAAATCRSGATQNPDGSLEWNESEFWPDEDVTVLYVR